jgi:hypothetical protein
MFFGERSMYLKMYDFKYSVNTNDTLYRFYQSFNCIFKHYLFIDCIMKLLLLFFFSQITCSKILKPNKQKMEIIARAKISESPRHPGMSGGLEEIRVNCDVK